MKVIRIVLLLFFFYSEIELSAQDMSYAPDSVFTEYVKMLRNKGNDYYMLSNRTGIKQVIDEYQNALDSRKAAGNLTEEAYDFYMQDIRKLNGDYHYENSDIVNQSYAEAEKYFLLYRDYYLNHPDDEESGRGLYIAHQELAQLYYKQGRYQEACDELKEVKTMADFYMTNRYEPSEKQSQYAICLARLNNFEEAIRNINDVINDIKEADLGLYCEALRKKAKILMLQEESGEKTDNTSALVCYKKYFEQKKKEALAHFMGMNSQEREQYWMRIRPFVTDCYRLEDTDAGFLFDVTLFAKGLLLQLDSAGGGRQNIHATWQMIQKRLKPDACAIEFIQYEKYGQQQMGALVLRKTGKPIFVKMSSPDSVMNYKIIVKGELIPVKKLIHSIHGSDYDSRVPRNKLYSDSTGLNRLIWNSEIVKAIGKTCDIWFAPDGYSHQLAIEYLLPLEMNEKRLHRLSSTRSLLDNKVVVSGSNALIVGGVNYLKSEDTQFREGNDSIAYNYIKQQKGVSFKYLPKSMVEAETIVKNRSKENNVLLVADRATEHSFRQLSPNYQLIHLSTHGYFGAADIPQGTDLKPCVTDQSLSESLLALAGVQHNISDDSFNQNHQDGILSAKEIASLDLSKTELVVLSCCETGLGYVTSDGVYGIQRGLKNAGVKALVCTLWDIDDEASNFFMANFHQYMANGDSVYQAFYKARNDMKDYSEEESDVSLSFNPSTLAQEQLVVGNNFSEPSYRDAFILIDAIEN